MYGIYYYIQQPSGVTTELRNFCVIAVTIGTKEAVTIGTKEEHIPTNALNVLIERLESLGIYTWANLRRFRKDKHGRKKRLETWMIYALFKSQEVYMAWLNNLMKLS